MFKSLWEFVHIYLFSIHQEFIARSSSWLIPKRNYLHQNQNRMLNVKLKIYNSFVGHNFWALFLPVKISCLIKAQYHGVSSFSALLIRQGPLTEDSVFRACMVPVLLSAGYTHLNSKSCSSVHSFVDSVSLYHLYELLFAEAAIASMKTRSICFRLAVWLPLSAHFHGLVLILDQCWQHSWITTRRQCILRSASTELLPSSRVTPFSKWVIRYSKCYIHTLLCFYACPERRIQNSHFHWSYFEYSNSRGFSTEHLQWESVDFQEQVLTSASNM